MEENGANFEQFQEAYFSQTSLSSYGGAPQPNQVFYSPEPVFVGYQPNYNQGQNYNQGHDYNQAQQFSQGQFSMAQNYNQNQHINQGQNHNQGQNFNQGQSSDQGQYYYQGQPGMPQQNYLPPEHFTSGPGQGGQHRQRQYRHNMNQGYQGQQGPRGRGGRGGRSRGSNRGNNYNQSRQKYIGPSYREFHQRFQHDTTRPDVEEESLQPVTDDHKVEEERTYNEALHTGQGQEQASRGHQRGGARPKHGRGNRYQNNYQRDNKPGGGWQDNRYREGRGGGGGGQREGYHRNEQWGSKGDGHSGHYGNKSQERNGHQDKALDGSISNKEEEKENMGKNARKLKFREYNSSRNNEQNKAPSSRGKNRNYKRINPKDGDQESQRGALIEQLGSADYECMVCCDVVRQDAAVWSCSNCYHVFHLRCIKRWARSPAASVEGDRLGGWRCPACQNVSQVFPHHYTCFCEKTKDPEWNRFDTPHSCGEMCSKNRGVECTHPCNILCHPGPCPPCLASVTKSCDCGKTRQTVKCGQPAPKCEATCSKVLNCGRHECDAVCHPGGCQPCSVDVHQTCYCGASERDVKCGTSESFSTLFSCGGICKRDLDCGNHVCDRPCHPGSCDPCKLRPSAVTHCACGKSLLVELGKDGERTSCLDPVPTCDDVCGKVLACGPSNKHHTCSKLCHPGDCEPCTDGTTPVVCRCAVLEKDFACREAIQFTPDAPFLCDKRCNKKRQCGRHRCPNVCCVDEEHPCDLTCGGKLSCGLHRCEEPCHRGNCPTCWRVSFDELHCHCGAEVMYPPIACGTKPPPCNKLCKREHNCNHPVRHACHSDAACPPCTELTERWCMGRHELRRNIPCHLTDISCGMPCGKDLPCKVHTCIKTCHKDACRGEGEDCQQLCTRPRPECGHPCGVPCHAEKPCPKTSCQTQILIKCKCGNRSERALCQQGAPDSSDYQKMATMMMAMKMADVQSGQSVDISSLTGSDTKKKTRQLECTKDCAILERNKRLALALEIKNPDIQGKLGNPTYSVFLRDFAKQNMSFVTSVEKQLSELVISAQKSKQPKRSHAFPPMNSAQRRLIHELSEAYGCQSQSYDVEPKKNVVSTACKDRCWQPTVTLSQCVMRELYPKGPVPIPHSVTEAEIVRSTPDLPTSRSTKVKMTPWGKGAGTPKTAPTDVPTVTPTTGGSSSWASQVRRTTPSSGTEEKPREADFDYFDMTD